MEKSAEAAFDDMTYLVPDNPYQTDESDEEGDIFEERSALFYDRNIPFKSTNYAQNGNTEDAKCINDSETSVSTECSKQNLNTNCSNATNNINYDSVININSTATLNKIDQSYPENLKVNPSVEINSDISTEQNLDRSVESRSNSSSDTTLCDFNNSKSNFSDDSEEYPTAKTSPIVLKIKLGSHSKNNQFDTSNENTWDSDYSPLDTLSDSKSSDSHRPSKKKKSQKKMLPKKILWMAPDASFFCDHCNSGFATQLGLNKHMRRLHNDFYYSPECSVCHKHFRNKEIYERHVKFAHLEKIDGVIHCTFEGCKKSYPSHTGLRKHILRVHFVEGTRFICDHAGCNAKFRQKSVYMSHLTKDHSEKPYKCQKCPATFTSKRSFQHHDKSHDKVSFCLKCDYEDCNETFSSKKKLSIHVKSHQVKNFLKKSQSTTSDTIDSNEPNTSNTEGSMLETSDIEPAEEIKPDLNSLGITNFNPNRKVFVCPICVAPVLTANGFLLHLSVFHKSHQKDALDKIVKDVKSDPETFRKRLKCVYKSSDNIKVRSDNLAADFIETELLDKEKENIKLKEALLYNKKVSCPYTGCNKIFKRLTLYKVHVSSCCYKQRTLLICPHDNCDNSFYLIDMLKKHIEATHTDSPSGCIKCSRCDKHIMQQSFRVHLRRCRGLKAYPCKFPGCDRVFAQSSSMTNHLAVHLTTEKIRRYTCGYDGCEKKFFSNNDLRKHETIHSGTRPFKCKHPGCDKDYKQVAHLNYHIKHVHTNPARYINQLFLCPVCGIAFKRKSNLTSHFKRKCGKKVNVESQKNTESMNIGDRKGYQHKLVHKDKQISPATHVCSCCSKSFKSDKDLIKHKSYYCKKRKKL